MAPPVGRPVECRRPGTRENDLGVRRVEGHFPDVELVHRRIQPLEMLAAVLAVVNAVVCPGEDRSRLFRVDGESENTAFRPEPRQIGRASCRERAEIAEWRAGCLTQRAAACG